MIVLGVSGIFLFTGAYEYFAFLNQVSRLRQQLENSQTQQLLALLPSIQELAQDENWGETSQEIIHHESILPQKHLFLVDRGGTILAQGQPETNLSQEMPSGPFDSEAVSARWLVKDRTLQISMPVSGDEQEVPAYLISISDEGALFRQLYNEQARHAAYLILVLLVLLGSFLVAVMLLFVRPIRHLYQMARAVRLGEPLEETPDPPVLELHQIKMAFHDMLDHLSSQQTSLEALNRGLEATAAERTTALQGMYTSIQHHVGRLEAINALTASTAGLLTLETLMQSLIDQVVQIFEVDRGGLWMGSTAALCQLSADIQQAAGRVSQKLVTDDWQSIPEDHPTKGLARSMQENGIAASILLPFQGPEPGSGMLLLASSQPRCWDPEEVALLEIVVHYFQIMAERIQSVENIRAHNRMMQALVTQSSRLNQSLTVEEIVVKIGEGALFLSQADRLAVFSNPQNSQAVCLWSHNLSDESTVELTAHLKEAITREGIDPLKPQFLPQTVSADEENPCPTGRQLPPIRSASLWPLVYQSQAAVFVGCYYSQPTRLTPNECELMEAFFRQAAAALENARLLEAESRQRQLAEALREIAAKLNSSLELEEVLDSILSNLGRVVPHDAAFLMRLEGEMVRPVRWRGLPEAYAQQIQNWSYSIHQLSNRQQMVETIQGLIVPDTHAEPSWVFTEGLEWVRSYAGAPICQQGEVTGFIDVMSKKPGFYGETHGPILQAFADQAALALENARMYQNTQQRMDETRALYRAVQPLFHPAEEIHLLAEQITRTVTQEFASAHCSILLLDESRTRLKLIAQAGSLMIMAPELSMDGPGLTVQAVKTGTRVYSPDVTQEQNYVHGADQSRSELAIPLHARGQVIGVLNLESPEIDAFDERGQQLLASFAEQAALGLENARLYESTHQRARELEALHTATTSLVTTLDQHTLLKRILAAAQSAIPSAEAAALHLVEAGGQLLLQIQHGTPEDEGWVPEWDHPNGPWAWSLKERQPLLIGQVDPPEENRFQMPETRWFTSYLIAPLIQEDQALGMLTLMSATPDAFTTPDLHLLISFASTATAAIHNAKLHSAVQYLAVTDPLTGVYNRRGFYELAQLLFEQAQVNHRALSAGMIDIDFFKHVNDQFGHDIGDIVLRKLADRCKRVLRDSDILCRYGGEEFAILLAETDLAGAEIAAHRLFNKVTAKPIQTDAGPVSVTISIGIAAKNEHCDTLQQLLKDADKALHKAKAEGRSQVQIWWGSENSETHPEAS